MNVIKETLYKLLFIIPVSSAMLLGAVWEILHLRNPKIFLDKAAKVTYKNYQNYCAKLGLRCR